MNRFNFADLVRTDAPEEWASHLAYTVSALIRASRLALENDNTSLRDDDEKLHAVANTLEIAEALNSIVIDGTETLERQCGQGVFKRGGCSMTGWEEAHNDTSAQLARIQGLFTALREIAQDWPALTTPDPMANCILTLIRTLHDDLTRLDDMHTAEWRAMKAKDNQPKG